MVISCGAWTAGTKLGNSSKAAAYLGARLEWYADTHAEQSPMNGNACLPAGRKVFNYAHRKDILERHGDTETDAEDASAYALASRRPKQARKARGGGEAEGASAYALASQLSTQTSRMADAPLASLNHFLKAWRVECPWLVVCKSVYLRLLIDQTPRGQDALRSALQARLGDRYGFQAARSLPRNRLEEFRAQSGGGRWFMLIDKMDTVPPHCRRRCSRGRKND